MWAGCGCESKQRQQSKGNGNVWGRGTGIVVSQARTRGAVAKSLRNEWVLSLSPAPRPTWRPAIAYLIVVVLLPTSAALSSLQWPAADDTRRPPLSPPRAQVPPKNKHNPNLAVWVASAKRLALLSPAASTLFRAPFMRFHPITAPCSTTLTAAPGVPCFFLLRCRCMNLSLSPCEPTAGTFDQRSCLF